MAGPKTLRVALVFAAMGLLLGGQEKTALAATYTWSNLGINWATPANWGGTAPGSGDIGLFNVPSGTGYSFGPNVAETNSIGGIWDTGSAQLTISGASTLTLYGTTINGNASTGIEMDSGAGALLISASTVLNSSQTWLNNSGSLLTVSSNITNGGSTLTVGGSSATTISGILGNGAGGLTMAGNSTLLLTNANTYTGTTTISAGTLQLGNGASGYDGSIAGASIVNNGALVYNLYSSPTYTGLISGSGGLTLLGGQLTLTNSNTFTGGVTISGGTLTTAFTGNQGSFGTFVATGTNAITIGPSGTLVTAGNEDSLMGWAANLETNWRTINNSGVMNDAIAFAMNIGPVVLSGGTMMATGPGDTYGTWSANNNITVTANSLISAAAFDLGGNQTTVTQRTFTVNPGVTLNVTGYFRNAGAGGTISFGLALAGGGTMILAGSDTYTGVTIANSGTLALANTAALSMSTFDASGAGTLSFGTLTSATFGGLQGVSGTLALNNTTPAPVALAVGANGNATTFAGALTGSGSLIKVGSGTLALAGNNSYSGGTQINAGALNLTGTLGGGGAITVGAGGTLTEGATGAILGTSSLTYNSASLSTLAGSNSYTNGTTINAGSLQFSTTSAVPNGAGSITVNSGGQLAANGAYPTVNGWLTSGGISTSSSGAIALTSANSDPSINFASGSGYNTLALGAVGSVTYGGTINPGNKGYFLGPTSGNTLTLTNSLTGASSLAMNGAGTTVLAASNGYTGTTTISTGTLQLGTGTPGYDGSLSTSSITNNSTLFYNLTASQTGSYGIVGSGNLTVGGSGALTLSGNVGGSNIMTLAGGGLTLAGNNNNYSGATNVNGGTLTVSGYLNGTGEVMAGDTANAVGVLAVTGTLLANRSTNPSIDVGSLGNANSVGEIRVFPGATVSTALEFHLGGNGTTPGYGAMTITGGSVASAAWFLVGAGGVAALNQSGGTLLVNNVNGGHFDMSCVASNSKAVANFSGNAVANLVNSLEIGQNGGNNGNAVVNISGSALVTTPAFDLGTDNLSNIIGTLNLLGGTLATGQVFVGNTGTNNVYSMLFNGGTLKATAGGTLLTGLTSAYVQGGTINNGGNAVTISQPLLTPSGSGVYNTGSLVFPTGNVGYVNTPVVLVTGGGGKGATAVANVSNGQVTGITITNPGTGYTSSPIFTLYGGGGAAVVYGSAGLAANTGGGLTFNGGGTTTLSASDNYSGVTLVSGGALVLANSAALSMSTFDASGAGRSASARSPPPPSAVSRARPEPSPSRIPRPRPSLLRWARTTIRPRSPALWRASAA